MRAPRLISVVLLLQTRGHMTAADLALELGVSIRTIYRDLEALGGAGVPVMAERGPGGGCRLMNGYRTQLTGLTPQEAEALFLSGAPKAAAELGLGSLLAGAELKVLAALPAPLRDAAALAHRRFLLDPHGWFQPAKQHPALPAVAAAVWGDRRVLFDYTRGDGAARQREADAVALVQKAELWSLVARVGDEVRVYRVSRMANVRVGEIEFKRDPSFDLEKFWAEWSARFEASLDSVTVEVRVSPELESYVERLGDPVRRPPAARSATPDGDGWYRRTLVFEKLLYARSALLGLGAGVEVLAPAELRDSLANEARAIAARYGAPAERERETSRSSSDS
jgi:predicted DNA-binding transcriptional regulator YafY